MKKINPTIGERQVWIGKLIWIMGSIVVSYDLIKSIIDKTFENDWKKILFFAFFAGLFGAVSYVIGKDRIERGKKQEQENNQDN